MLLKDLRIKAGFTQEECAKFLGIAPRTYQNYENDEKKVNSAKYNLFIKKLENYINGGKESARESYNVFHTNVTFGDSLTELYEHVKRYKKRNCYASLKKFLDGDYYGRICILYGLRRTGKTTLLFQTLGELPKDKTAYIKIRTTDNMSDLTKDLKLLDKQGFKYILIDEATLMEDFINTAAVLSDIFGMLGMKIVVSGTDSLGFAMADRDELYDRNVMIHTSFIPFREYAYLLGINSVDSYIEYGGTLKMENMSFDDEEAAFDEVSFRDDESTRKYIDTAISRNIQHTLKNDSGGEYFNQLRELYDAGELTNIINRIVERMNHDFLLSVVQETFKSHDLGSAKQLLLHDVPLERAHVLYDIDGKKVTERLKAIIEVKEKYETKIVVTQEHIDKVKKYLIMLDLIQNCPTRIENGSPEEHYIFVQPGMRYSIAKALVYSLMQDEYFMSIPSDDRKYIVDKILSDVKGRMLEDIVLLETSKALPKKTEAFKFKFESGGEFDMVILDRENWTCSVYEVKHSAEMTDEQARHLRDEEKINLVNQRFGKVIKRCVLYRGKNCIADDGIEYRNVEEYLKEL